MVRYRNAMVMTLLALALASAAALSQAPPAAPSGPLRVTTDTVEYCDTLAGQVATVRRQHPTAEPEAERLAAEGQHMCDTGLVRAGLLRLRRALLMLQAAQ
jgi:hypothetical protein